MSRRLWLFCLTWFLAGLAALATRRRLPADEQQANLNETLRSVLKCRRSQEFAFVDLVTQKVDQGQLTRDMVLGTMNWALKRSRHEVVAGRRKNDFPFPYFQEGLRRQAAAIGVALPAFEPFTIQ
jgi:hypothetical protein